MTLQKWYNRSMVKMKDGQLRMYFPGEERDPVYDNYVMSGPLRRQVVEGYRFVEKFEDRDRLRRGAFVDLDHTFPNKNLGEKPVQAIRRDLLVFDVRTGDPVDEENGSAYKFNRIHVQTKRPLVDSSGEVDPALDVCLGIVLENGSLVTWTELGVETTPEQRKARKGLFRARGLTDEKSTEQKGLHPEYNVTTITCGRLHNKASRSEVDALDTRAAREIRQRGRDLERAMGKTGWRADRTEQEDRVHHTKNVKGAVDMVRVAGGIEFQHEISGAQTKVGPDGTWFEGYAGVENAGNDTAYYPPAPVPTALELDKAVPPINKKTPAEICAEAQRVLHLSTFNAAAIPPRDGYPPEVSEHLQEPDPKFLRFKPGSVVDIAPGKTGVIVEAHMPVGGNLRKLQRQKVVFVIDS